MRINTWEDALADYIATKRQEPFEYGVNDCSMFAAGAVIAITGEDPIPELRGQYDSLKTSLIAIRDIGAGTLEATIDAKFSEVAIGHAQRGDLAFFDDSVGVVMGGFAYFVSEDGLERINRSLWDKCWGVGRG